MTHRRLHRFTGFVPRWICLLAIVAACAIPLGARDARAYVPPPVPYEPTPEGQGHVPWDKAPPQGPGLGLGRAPAMAIPATPIEQTTEPMESGPPLSRGMELFLWFSSFIRSPH